MTDRPDVHGDVAPGFEPVRETFAAHLADLGDGGAAYAAFHRGEKVVDLWAGDAAPEVGGAAARPWEESTTNLWMSTTKAVVALCLQMLHDRGVVDVFAPVSKYWPEFAAEGKGDITVAHVLTHTSGVMGSPDVTALVDLDSGDGQDRTEEIAAALAAAAPMWEPGTSAGYHTTSYGYLLSEIVRRAEGRTLGQFLREEVVLPLGVPDVRLGTPADEHDRIATILPFMWPDGIPEEITAYMNWFLGACRDDTTPAGVSCLARDGVGALDRLPELFNAAPGRVAELGSSNLVGTARSVAKIFAAVAEPGELDGVRLASPESRELFTTRHESRPDTTLGFPVARGLGYNLNQPLIPRPPTMGPNPTAFGHGGVGGQMGFADPAVRVGAAYTRNHYTVFPAMPMLLHGALYQCLPA